MMIYKINLNELTRVILMILSLALFSCGGSPEEFKPSIGGNLDNTFGPRHEDTNVTFSSQQDISAKKNRLNFSGEVPSSEILSLSKSLFQIGKSGNDQEITTFASKLTNQFYNSSENISTQAFDKSHFINAILAQVESGFKDALSDLDGQGELVIQILTEVTDKYTFADKQNLAADATAMLTEAIDRINSDATLIDQVKTSVNDLLNEYLNDYLPPTATEYNQLLVSNNPQEILALIESALARFDYQLEGSTKKKIDDIKPIAAKVEAINGNAQNALTAIVMLWEAADSAQRLQFKDVSSALYDQLKDADRETLECWKRNDFCWDMGFGVWLIEKPRKKILYNELESFGIGKIQDSLREQLTEGIRAEVFALIDDFKSDLTDIFDRLVAQEFDAKVAELQDSVADIGLKLQPEITNFSSSVLGSNNINLYETSNINFNMISSASIETQALQAISSSNTSAGAFGYGLSAQALKWNESQSELLNSADKSLHQREVISALEKVFSMGGYTGVGGQVVSGINRSVANPTADSYDLNNTADQSLNFAISDQQMISGAANLDQNISIAGQAAVINGIVDMMSYMRDWVSNSYDDAFTGLNVTQILTQELKDMAGEQGNQELFPKSQMYSLLVGQVAIILQGLELPGSPLVLIQDSRFEFVKDKSTFDNITPVAVAAVGWTNNQRDFSVKVRDLADYLYALTRLHGALGEISNTTSTTLTDNSKGESSADQLLSARNKELRSLILGMANFLVSRAQTKSGAVAEEVELNGFRHVGVGQTVRTQVRVIRALMAASEVLNSDVYQWGAQDIYFNLNANAWNTDIDFYQLEDQVDIFQVTDTIEALTALRPSLNDKSRSQLDVILSRWLEALRTY